MFGSHNAEVEGSSPSLTTTKINELTLGQLWLFRHFAALGPYGMINHTIGAYQRGADLEVAPSALIEGEETGKPSTSMRTYSRVSSSRTWLSTGFPFPNTSARDATRHTLLARILRDGSLATTRRAELLDESTLYRT
jgi:hypothetical protein